MATECAAKGLVAEPCATGAHRRCGSCGAVAYCSRAHQLVHWSIHKDECARFATQMSHIDMLNQFPFTFSMEPLPLGEIMALRPFEEDEITRLKEMGTLEHETHRLPSTRCIFLQLIKVHLKGIWMSECICGPEVTSVKDLSITKEWNMESSLCPCKEPRNPLPTLLTSWEDYYQWRSLPLKSPVAVLLHWPLTLYHCLQLSRTQISRYEDQSTLRIHYLGPEKELLQLAVFAELRALFPGVQLCIEFVGPAVPKSRDGEVVNISSYANCSDESCHCRSSIRSEDSNCTAVTLKLWKGLYHERYIDMIKDSTPHLILAPNAGVAAYSSWMPTIAMIRETGTPAFFTDYCEEAAHLASCCISSITGQPLRVPIQVNPFRQPIAESNSALHIPCYSNCFIFGM